VTEYCVSCAVKGLLQRKRRVAVVRDAIETLASDVGDQTLNELRNLGATLVTTETVLEQIKTAKSLSW
jgi:nicotinamidase-related amidase